MAIKSLFFDLDGTLTDSREGIVKSLKYAIQGLGMGPIPDERLTSFIGPPLQDTFTLLAGSSNRELIEKGMMLYRKRYSDTGMFENRVFDGIVPLLSALEARQYNIFVATSKPRIYAEPILDHFKLSGYFKRIYGQEMDGTRRHKDELISYILEQEGILADTAVMVGDRLHDIQGAKANQVAGIGVTWGYGTAAELEAAGAWKLCSVPKQIMEMI